MINTPKHLNELITRAEQIAGLNLSQLATQHQLQVPDSLVRHKGWVGNLLEVALGASAGSKPEQDFPELGVELKTIPIDRFGKPLETTFVCITPLIGITGLTWENSNVRNKLSQVLWVPILAEKNLPVAERIIGTPFLWQPSEQQQAQLKADWEEIMEMIALGKVEQITARIGQVIQLRPKGANSKALTDAIGQDGSAIKTLPRGFYLKINFTHQLLKQQFGLV